jgi:Tol biopolymer transport system component
MVGGPPAWTADSRDIVFSSGRAGPFALWRIPSSGGTAQRVESMGTFMMAPAMSTKGHRLAYTNSEGRDSFWSVRLLDPTHTAGSPQLFFGPKGNLGSAYFSADATRIVFESSQSGYDEIWTINSDGSNPAQLTFLRGESGTPRWSYDGRSVAFDYRPSERSEIYIVDYLGAPPRKFPTNPGADNVVPSWSRDGHWIYFASSRGNEPSQVWKAHYPEGGTIQLTQNGGMFPVESTGGFLYFSKSLNSDEIWKIPVDGGPESLVLKAPDLDCFCNWALGPTGIYFITQKSEQQPTLSFYDLGTKKLKQVLRFEKYATSPAISPDGKFLIYSQTEHHDNTIMLVNNFH